MKITAPCVITLTWTLKDSLNQEIDSLEEPTPYFYGGNDLLPKVEEALLEHEPGEQLDLYLEPSDAFGDYDSDLVFFEKKEVFPEQTTPGLQFEGLPQGAQSQAPADIIYTITEVYDTHIVVDGNHPLAGISLKLHLDIKDVRPATPEEIENASIASGMFNMFEVADVLPMGKKIH